MTFGYLVLLSRIGERMAVDMRRALFSNLLRYCRPQGVGAGDWWPGGGAAHPQLMSPSFP